MHVGDSLSSWPRRLRGRPRRLREGHPAESDKQEPLKSQQSFNLHSADGTGLTELPGELGAALQSRVAERVPAVHQPGVGQSSDTPQGQQVGVLQPRAPGTVQDAPLQGAKAAILRVAEDFDAVGPCQVT